jgi:signal transduction histidine kinase
LATVRALRTGEAINHYQEVIRRPDGTSMPILLNAVTLDPGMLAYPGIAATPESGEAPMPERLTLVVLQDVTAMKEAERLKDEFIAIAAHELKTPMAAVKGYADMLMRHSQDDDATTLEPWQVEALETIDQATNRLVELTEDLLDVARLQAERIQLHSEPHDLIALARRVIKRFQMASDRHTLSLVAADEFVVATLDVRRTEQIVGNLLSNAIKYSPDGGPVTITIEQDDGARMAKLSVRDRGIGIPANQQSLLFNRFARADNARERGITGTGLGLYLCRELVELQGGRLWFTSEEGCGSTFYVALPLAEEPS